MKRMEELERLIRQISGPDRQSYQFKDLCCYPDAVLPSDFRTPDFKKYKGRGCPIAHLKAYYGDMAPLQADDRLLIRLFQKSLAGPALQWFVSLDMNTIQTWDQLSQAFIDQYAFNLDRVPKREDLQALRQRSNEAFAEYVGRWRELAVQVHNKPTNDESIEMIIRGALPAIEALLDLHSLSTFASLIKAGTKIEASLRKGNFANIISQKAAGETSQSNAT
jgi:hypothetical protein